MRLALEEAKEAGRLNEVPVGAVLIDNNQNILSKAHNLRESKNDPLAHAEIIAISEASRQLGSWRLTGTTLYVTLEPCVMCMGAIVNSRIERVVFGARDPKAGALVSNYKIGVDKKLNHAIEYSEGILEKDCSRLLKNFFEKLRKD